MRVARTTAFRILNATRASCARAAKTYMVKSVNKDGSLSRTVPTNLDWQLNAFASAGAAEARRVDLERLNPGGRYVVVRSDGARILSSE